jgi:hypothetical protein
MSLVLYLLALLAIAAMAPGATVYWDAFGYVLQAVNGDVGGLGLGRPVFVLALHAIARGWLNAGGSPWQLEMVLRIACALAASAAAPLTAHLAQACGLSRRTAWMSGLAVAMSPAMAHASGQVLADGPGVSLVVLACVLGVRAAAGTGSGLAAGLVLGLAVGVREQTVVTLITLLGLAYVAPRQARWRIAGAMLAGCVAAMAVPLAFVLFTQPAYGATVRAWLANMHRDRLAKTYGWRDLSMYVAWLLSLGPIVVVAGAAAIALAVGRRRWRTPLLAAVVVPALLQVVWMATFRGIAYSPRFLLVALPGAFAIPASMLAGAWADRSRRRWQWAVAAWTVPLLVAAPLAHARTAALVATLQEWPARLESLPDPAVVVTGQPCPAVPLVRRIVGLERAGAALPDWQAVCPGWAWPSDLPQRLDSAMAEDRLVAADLREASWTGPEQRAALDELSRYVRLRPQAEASGRLIVWRDARAAR